MERERELRLIRRAKAEDTSAFMELVREYEVPLRSYLGASLADTHMVDDLAQEAFLAAYRGLAGFEDARLFEPWLRRIARNKLTSHLRKHYCEKSMMEEIQVQILEDTSDALGEVLRRDSKSTIEWLQDCLGHLTQKACAMVKARYFDEEKVLDIAGRLKTTPNAVSTILYHARKSLRTCMDEEGHTHG